MYTPQLATWNITALYESTNHTTLLDRLLLITALAQYVVKSYYTAQLTTKARMKNIR